MSDLFAWARENPARVRHTDPETSRQAAKSVNTAALNGAILRALRELGAHGATSEELAERLGRSRVTVSPQLRPMCRKGLVLESDARRPGASGRLAIVWVAKGEDGA